MKLKAICPHCKDEIIICADYFVRAKLLVHYHEDTEAGREGLPDFYNDVEWEIIEK